MYDRKNSFSIRMGLEKVNDIIQVDDMDDNLRRDLAEFTNHILDSSSPFIKAKSNGMVDMNIHEYIKYEYAKYSYTKIDIDYPCITNIKELINKEPYQKVYTLIEIIISFLNSVASATKDVKSKIFAFNIPSDNEYIIPSDINSSEYETIETFKKSYDKILKNNNSGYRLVNNIFVKSTSETEIEAIETAIKNSEYELAGNYIENALKLYAKTKDYNSSIVSSVKAIESILRTITGKANLGDSIKELQKKKEYNIPNPFWEIFDKIYVYRHNFAHGEKENKEQPVIQATEDEAYFMLVTCSATVNYLIKKLEK